jgi:hypothetical protein
MAITTDLPPEALETLRDINAGEPGLMISEPMLQLLVEEGYVESLDGVPTLTESGSEMLNSTEQKMPGFLYNTD